MAVLRVLAVLAVALYLIPGGAHVLEMSNKLALPLADYMVMQGIYTGWDRAAYALLAALVFTILHAIIAWRLPIARWLSLGAFLALIGNLAIFFAYTYPINVLTRNWTVAPEDFETARRQWEYSHAVNAGLVLLAFLLILSAVLASSYASGMVNQASDQTHPKRASGRDAPIRRQ
jgi:hypothetical protein